MIKRISSRSGRFARSSRRKLVRASKIEGLEKRFLLTIDNPIIVPIAPLPVEGNSLGANSPVVATFASPAAIGNLSATVAFPAGTTTSNIVATGGTETIDGMNIPEFHVVYTGNWTPPDESPAVPYTVTITDSTGGTGNTTSIQGSTPVSDAPLTTNNSLVGTVAFIGDPVDFSGANFLTSVTDANPNATASDFTVNIDWGDGTSSIGDIAKNGSTFEVTGGPHTFFQSTTVHYEITDKGGSSVEAPPLVVTVNTTPLTTNNSLIGTVAIEGVPLDFTGANFLTSLSDANPDDTPSDLTVSIDWGDGTSSIGDITKNGSTFQVTAGPHTFFQSTTVHYKITDKFGASVDAPPLVVNVTDAPLSNGAGTSFTGVEGQTISNVLLGTFTDGNPFATAADFSAKIDWGDGSAVDTGTVSVIGGDANGAILGIYGNHTYVGDATTPFAVTVDVADKDGSTLPTIDSTATISDPLLIMAGGYKVNAVEGTSTGTQTVATFIDPGGNESPANYTATVNWGDGTTSAGTISFANGFFSVSGPHTYAHAQSSPYIITTTITHVAGIPQTVTSSATITKAPLAGSAVTIHGSEGRSSTVTVANFTAATATSASSFTASINWGDGKTTTGTIVKDSSGKYHVTASHAYAEENSSGYAVKVTIKQSGGATITVNSKAEIADSPLDQGAGVTTSATKNSTFSNKTLGTFRDQDALNKIAGDYAGTIDWGDGKTSAASFVFTGATANVGSFWKVTGSHKYTAKGTFTVKITIRDTGSPSKNIVITSMIKVS